MLNKRVDFYSGFICMLLFITSTSWAAKPTLGDVKPGSYQLLPITNHTPALYKKNQDYLKSLQKIELTIGSQEKFTDLPKLGLKNPYTGFIVLGDKPEKLGVIIDIVGEEKRLYIDTNGDGSFIDEPWVPLLNEWLGIQNYWVISPEPIRVNVRYNFKPTKSFPIEISIEGLLLKPGALIKEKPYLLVEVRTWFLAKVMENGAEKYMAVIDQNNNGRFNDPNDALLVDYNNDSFFTKEEMITYKRGIMLKNGKQELGFSWEVYPDSLVIGVKK